MQVVYENTALFPRAEDGTFAQSGSVALEPKTGGVRGVVGQVAGNDKTGFRNSTMQLNQNVVLVLQLSL